ncbi:hypothetical protein HG531_009480 [Fusarium graminearum]|nr:hypothetical protein HG531_009480 [Fusarium graminearum]
MSKSQAVSSLLGSGRGKLEGLEETSQTVGDGSTPSGHAHNGEEVTDSLDVAELTSQRPVPGKGVGAIRKILVVEHFEARVVDGSDTLRDLAHVGNTITLFDTQSNLTVAEVVVVVLVSHEPLVHTEDTTGLKNTENLAVDALESGSVNGGLNGINGIEAVVGERHLLPWELACIQETEVLVGQTLLEGVVGSSLDLVVVVVQAGNMSTCELGDLTGGTTHTATDIKNLHAVLDTDLVGKVVLMTGNGLVKGLALGESAEVEGLAPSVFVEIGSKVVVAARFDSLLRSLVLCGLVIPVLEVLINSSLLSSTALAEHGSNTTSSLG